MKEVLGLDNAILYAGIEELNTIKEYVLELKSYEEKNAELEQEEARLEKVISGKKKEMADEIEVVRKKRKKELTTSYENQIAKLNSKAKKIKSQKGKEKGQKVAKRVTTETAELRDANNAILIDIKALMKKNKTPKICNTTLFYSLFMPRASIEFLTLFFIILISFLILPLGIYWLFFMDYGVLAIALIYIIDIFLFGGVYIMLNNILKPMSEEERENHTKEEKLREEYLKGVKFRFLNYARTLPGSEVEAPNDELFKIKGEIKDNKIQNLKVYTWSLYIKEEMDKMFSSKTEENYFTIDINGNVDINSDEIPDELLEIVNNILQDKEHVYDETESKTK